MRRLVILVGDTGVGKTHILSRYIRNALPKNKYPTIGVEFATKSIHVEGKIIKAQIWDTAGQESFASIITSYYRGIAGAAVVFDLSRKDSFRRVDFWLRELKEKRDRTKHITTNP